VKSQYKNKGSFANETWQFREFAIQQKIFWEESVRSDEIEFVIIR